MLTPYDSPSVVKSLLTPKDAMMVLKVAVFSQKVVKLTMPHFLISRWPSPSLLSLAAALPASLRPSRIDVSFSSAISVSKGAHV